MFVHYDIIRVHTCVCMYVSMHVFVCIYIVVYIYIHILFQFVVVSVLTECSSRRLVLQPKTSFVEVRNQSVAHFSMAWPGTYF